jgi:hypothetical protein
MGKPPSEILLSYGNINLPVWSRSVGEKGTWKLNQSSVGEDVTKNEAVRDKVQIYLVNEIWQIAKEEQ